jgi:hypothetical protein
MWDGSVCRLEKLGGVRTQIRESRDTGSREVSVTELRGAASLPALQLDQCFEDLRAVDKLDSTKAQQREAAIRDALHRDGLGRRALKEQRGLSVCRPGPCGG